MVKVGHTPQLIQDIVYCLGEHAIIYHMKHGDNQIIQARWENEQGRLDKKQQLKELEIWVRKDLLQDVRDANERERAELIRKVVNHMNQKLSGLEEQKENRSITLPTKEVWIFSSELIKS